MRVGDPTTPFRFLRVLQNSRGQQRHSHRVLRASGSLLLLALYPSGGFLVDRLLLPFPIPVLAAGRVGGLLGHFLRGGLRLAGGGGFRTPLWGRRGGTTFPGQVVDLGAGLRGSRGALGGGGRVAGRPGLGGGLGGFGLLLLTELCGQAGLEGERAGGQAGGAAAGARVAVAAAGARMPGGRIRTPGARPRRPPAIYRTFKQKTFQTCKLFLWVGFVRNCCG